ncbi:MAG: cryptochrome/photolyase family protein [Cyanobacteria bacterium P01_F01_bin.42]
MLILFGTMLFPSHASVLKPEMPIFMAEDDQFCARYRYHKHKLMLVLAAMRHHRDELQAQGHQVIYQEVSQSNQSYEDKLLDAVQANKSTELHTYELEDFRTKSWLTAFCDRHGLKLCVHDSPLFMTTHEQFQDYRKRYKRFFMADFYKIQRRRLDILLEGEEPVGGQWSFDQQNREKLPKSVSLPGITLPSPTSHVKAVGQWVEATYPDNPGSVDNFWLPVTRKDAIAWMNQFFTERFDQFGPYEDALSDRDPFLFHSVLSPVLNVGLITPAEVVEAALDYAENHDIPLNSLEGFIRQIIGWREYIRGVYHVIGQEQQRQNELSQQRQLASSWYEGTTGLVPVDQVIDRVLTRGWAHHIERLMVISNAMLLCEIHPDAVYRWFMELFVDSAEWVMVPNVYGMGQFADGGIMMTKPYISGSNYLRKMGPYKKGDWCEVWDGLYWRFIDRHQAMIKKNHRMSMMASTLKRMNPEKRDRLF